jgi:hypothetical protein
MVRTKLSDKKIEEVRDEWIKMFNGDENHGEWHDWFYQWTEIFNALYYDKTLTEEAVEQAQDKILMKLITDSDETSLVTQLIGIKKDLGTIDLESERYSYEYLKLKNGLYIVTVYDEEEGRISLALGTRNKREAQEYYKKAIEWVWDKEKRGEESSEKG